MQMVSQILFTIEIPKGVITSVFSELPIAARTHTVARIVCQTKFWRTSGHPIKLSNFAHVKFSNPLPPPIPSNFGAAPGPLSASA